MERERDVEGAQSKVEYMPSDIGVGTKMVALEYQSSHFFPNPIN